MNYYNTLNFKKYDPDSFKKRFKREIKIWTISSLYALYEKTLERTKLRKQNFNDLVKKILNEIEPKENGTYSVYFERSPGDFDAYRISKGKRAKSSWSYYIESINYSKNIKRSRDQKLEILFTNPKAFELGEKLGKLSKLRSNLDLKIFHFINELVNEELNLKFKEVENHKIPEILRINILDKIYFVKLTNETRNTPNYKRFKIISEDLNDQIIVI
jgi:hypothetical protein